MNNLIETDLVIFVPTVKELKMLGVGVCSVSGVFRAALFENIPVIVTGIGKSNASFAAAAFFSKYKVSTCILAGICGAYPGSGLVPGDAVCVKYDYFADEGKLSSEGLATLHELGLPLCENNRAEFETAEGFRAVDSNTVSLIPADATLSEKYRTKTGALVENMEGAALGTAAERFGVRAFQLRAVSNFCGPAEIQKWNIKAAAEALNPSLKKIIGFARGM